MHYPDFETFTKHTGNARLVPVYRRLVADCLTPVSAFHKLDKGPCACLFESVVGGEKVGRYSFLTADPFLQVEARGPKMTVVTANGTEVFESADPLAELKRRIDELRAVRLSELPPFIGGAVGYAGYDVVRYTENLPHAPLDDRQLPDLAFAFYDRMVVFDNINKTMVVVAMARLEEPMPRARMPPLAAAWTNSRRTGRTRRRTAAGRHRHAGGDPQIPYRSNFTPADFERAVEKCVEYIRAGDIFQVVLSQRLELDIMRRSLRDLPHAASRQSQPIHVLPADAERDARGKLAGGAWSAWSMAASPSARWPARAAAAHRGRRPAARRGVARRSQGAGRARDARRSGAQRRGPRRPLSLASNLPT